MTAIAPPAAHAEQMDYSDSVRERLRTRITRLTGFDIGVSEQVAAEYAAGLWVTDPIAERFVAEVYHGEIGAERGRELVELALKIGIENVPDAPESMVALFEDFEAIPDWVDRDRVEAGAAVWRRWGYDMGSIANSGTMDTYTEGWLATPLSLAGGYAGKGALHRHLETSLWWLETSRAGAVFDRHSKARDLSIKIRIMHVSVRHGVAMHPEWHGDRWGAPISQSEMLLTLIGGSVAPALGLYNIGYLTSPREMRDVLHFCRYLGHLLGVKCDSYYPAGIADAVRLLYHFDATRAYDGGHLAGELVESFVPSFAPNPDDGRVDRWRARYHLQIQAGFTRFFMLPWNRRRYAMPSGALGTAFLIARTPAIIAIEIARRPFPAVDRWWQRTTMRRWQHWIEWASDSETARYRHYESMRR